MIGTKEKFRHYRPTEDGRELLLWASNGKGSIVPRAGEEIFKGTRQELELIRDQRWTPNDLADEGEKDILDVYFDVQAVRATLYGRLYNDTPSETDTLASLLNEQAGSGYAAIAITRGTDWTAPALDAGDMQTDMTTKTFTATGAWTAVTYFVLATTSGAGGLLIAYSALSATRTLASGESLNVDLSVKLA